ncbi:MAG: SCO1664 family protein [bacterium]|nr:SCO1664 family protein [bacterium]
MSDENPQDEPKGTPITFERALEVLTKGKIDTEHGSIRWSSNYTFLVSVTHEDSGVMAIYKPQRGERPLWDFPDGTLCYRERAAFLTSEAVGWQLVPPTVLREDAPRGLGSLQFYIDHDPDYNYFSFDESLLPQLMRLTLFDFLVNNADRKGGHCLVDSQNHLWGIDHGLTFHPAHKLRTVVWNFAGQPVPEALLMDVECLLQKLDDTKGEYRTALCQLISEPEMHALHARIRRLLKTRHYPNPGPGPNYPWPPV